MKSNAIILHLCCKSKQNSKQKEQSPNPGKENICKQKEWITLV